MSLYTAGMLLSALSPLDPFSQRDRGAYKKSVSLIRRRLGWRTATPNSNAAGSGRRFYADFSRGRRADSTFAAAGKFSSPLVARSAARPAVSVILPAATQPSPPSFAPALPQPIHPKLVPSRLAARPRPSYPPRRAAPPPPRHRVALPSPRASRANHPIPTTPATHARYPLPSTAPLCEPLVNLLAPL